VSFSQTHLVTLAATNLLWPRTKLGLQFYFQTTKNVTKNGSIIFWDVLDES
jgi:hypothetical protein